VERALDLLITQLERRRLGRAARPRQAPLARSRPRRGYVPRAVRREVFARDGEQCTFVDAAGRRCESHTLLELDHVTARARGGTDCADNLRGRCRQHNALAAERDFGRALIERKKRENHPRQRGYDDPRLPGRHDHRRPPHDHNDTIPLRALRGMGFKESEARHALEVVARGRAEGAAPPLEAILRQALSLLA
jgi:5-methylcytosine-specific restriction endonuclease McrA